MPSTKDIESRKLAQELLDDLRVVALYSIAVAKEEVLKAEDPTFALGRKDMAEELLELIKRQAEKHNLRTEGWYRQLRLAVDNTK